MHGGCGMDELQVVEGDGAGHVSFFESCRVVMCGLQKKGKGI